MTTTELGKFLAIEQDGEYCSLFFEGGEVGDVDPEAAATILELSGCDVVYVMETDADDNIWIFPFGTASSRLDVAK